MKIGNKYALKVMKRRSKAHSENYPNIAGYAYDVITHEVIVNGVYEKLELDFIRDNIFPKLEKMDTCLDVGANIGNHSLYFSNYFSHVIAFEPHPRTFELLLFNSHYANNITPLRLAASDKKGTAMAAPTKPINIGTTSLEDSAKNAKDATDLVEFDLMPIDHVDEVRSCKNISFMKIDVEGHELPALRGAKETLISHRPIISMEILRDNIKGGQPDSIEFLKEIGYRYFYEVRPPIQTMKKRVRRIISSICHYTNFTYPVMPKIYRIDNFDYRHYYTVLCSTRELV